MAKKMAEDKKHTEEESKVEEQATETNSASEEASNEAEAQENQEPTLEQKYEELNNKYLRIHAEFDNYRKRTNKEKVDLIGSANAGVLKELLPVLDDFERAIANNEKSEDIASVKEGFNLIFNKFSSILKAKGLKEMPATGESFDSELHEAIANVPAPKKKLKGKVVDTVEKGYYLNDKVIRYAKVVVGQ
jgi:molecular chaperone GrpE